jgi:4-hydroxy-tetrahydrodipicolinate reductase
MSLPRTRVGVHGAGGRMGRAIVKAVLEAHDLELVAAVDREGSPALGSDAGELALAGRAGLGVSAGFDALARAEVIIDFSSPAGTAWLAGQLAGQPRPLVVGTTGLDEPATRALAELSSRSAVLVAPNTSIGVNVLFHLAAEAARLLGDEFDAEIFEMHHKLKVDAPSGTALRLAERVKESRGFASTVHGRSGQVGARPAGEIGILAARGGDVVGEHTLIFAGPGERVELVHRAHERGLFARGALRAARFVKVAPPGRYDMSDALGMPRPTLPPR